MKPVIGVLCSAELIDIPGWGSLSHQAVFERYLLAASSCCDALPLLIGATGDLIRDAHLERMFERLDGIILPGAASNVDVALYGGTQPQAGSVDRTRDGIAMRIVREAVTSGRPVLGICRGMQEINVALGGTLYAALHAETGRFDHRANRMAPFEDRYRDAHAVELVRGGWLDKAARRLPPRREPFRVNSLHGQGIAALAGGLAADAYADDGTIEAISHVDAPVFGVQWHPEWHVPENPLNGMVWARFRRECEAFLARRLAVTRPGHERLEPTL